MFITGVSLVMLLGTSLLIKEKTDAKIYSDAEKLPHAQVALVPGAAILRNGNISPVFQDRVDAALVLYKTGKVEKILVSGDNSTVAYNEVNPVQTYLIEQGVPGVDIYLDHAGFDTYNSMYRARAIFEVKSVTIVTQSFHLPRSVYIARALGIDAYGYNADSGHYLLKNYIREYVADVKAFIDLAVHRTPKFLGDTIPIE